MTIDNLQVNEFTIQFGDIRGMHSFDGIIGSDFFLEK